jgi:hypothetical protein
MKCSIYDWIGQSNQHLAYAREHYPRTCEVYMRANDRNTFFQIARAVNLGYRGALKRERDQWFSKHGYAWKRLGCPREVRMYQRSFSMTAPVVGASSVFDEDYGEEDGWFDDATGTSSGDLPPMYEGLPSDPKLPEGYQKCYNPDVQGMPVTVDVPTNASGWKVDHYVGKDDEIYYFYHTDYGDSFWACPKLLSTTAPHKEEIKQIQTALMVRGYNPGPVDGIWGPKTCSAMYAYAHQYRGYADPTLDEDLFDSLGLGGRGYGSRYARSCDTWFTGELGGTPKPIVEPEPGSTSTPGPEIAPEPEPAPEPLVNKAGFGLAMGVLILGAIVGTAYVDHKKRKKR